MGPSRFRISVIIASKGRPSDLARWIDHMRRQTYPGIMIWSVTSEQDLPPDWQRLASPTLQIVFGPAGLCFQRNVGMDAISAPTDVVAFFDDDYVPSSHALAGMARFFAQFPEALGVTGLLLDDGVKGPGISDNEADARVAQFDASCDHEAMIDASPREGLYGCNMAFRMTAIKKTRFDERLPLYGWQEDIDFSFRIAMGRGMYGSNAFTGVHQGAKRGRAPGRRLGYAQIANPIYLFRKGTMSFRFMADLIVRNFLSNHLKSFWPEPWVDRRGRVAGNWLGIRDAIRGTIDPRRMQDL